jgi:hypothetical protein
MSEDNVSGQSAKPSPTGSEDGLVARSDPFDGNEPAGGNAPRPHAAARDLFGRDDLLKGNQIVGANAAQPPTAAELDDCPLTEPWPADDERLFDLADLPNDGADQWRLPDEDSDPSADPPSWLTDEFFGNAEAEHAAWLAGLPDDIRDDYLAGPYTGAGEAIPPGFTHRDPGGPSGAGFAAGGALDHLAPGPWLASELATSTADGYDRLTDSEQIGVLLGWQRQAAWAQAGLAAAVSGVRDRRLSQSTRPGWSRVADHITDEVAIALRLTTLSAGRLLGVAAGLDRLPPVAAALAVGQIDWAKACLLAGELAVLTDEQALDIAARLLREAGDQTTGQLRAALARAILAADPHAAERRKHEGRKDTRVELWHEPSGNAVLAGRELRPADAIAADAQLTADARWLRTRGMPGTLAELRAAAYLTRLSGLDLTSMLLAADGNSDHPASNHPASDHPASNHPASNHPASDHPASDHPASADTANDKSASARGRSPSGPGSAGESGPGSGGAMTGTSGSASGSGTSGSGPAGPPGGTINLTMPLSAFAGLTDNPGEVAGHGVIDAATGRDLAARLADTARWCLTLTDTDGRAVAHACARRGHRSDRPEPGEPGPAIRWAVGLIDRMEYLETGTCSHSRRSAGYTPPTALRHLVEIRQRTCCAPGCRRAAGRCDIDHTIPFDQGGITCECNTAPGCRRHHRCKQLPGWHVTQDQPGVMTWRLPGGRTRITSGDVHPV